MAAVCLSSAKLNDDGASNKKCLNVEETRDLTKKAVNKRFYNLLLGKSIKRC